MKIEITEYIDNRLTCQKVEAQQQHLVSELRPSDIPTWKWDLISMDFIMGLPLSTLKKYVIME